VASRPEPRRSRATLFAGVALAILSTLAAASQPAVEEFKFEVVKSFESTAHLSAPPAPGRGDEPVVGIDGALYGTTYDGGPWDRGTVFRIDSGGNFTRLHAFSGPDGDHPIRPLVQGKDGALYGLTDRGGSFGGGTVFKIDSLGAFVSLHSFPPGFLYGGLFGVFLVVGNDGALYGATTNFRGTIFKIDGEGNFTSLHSFDDVVSALVVGRDGALYGTVGVGSCSGNPRGAIFRIDGEGNVTTLHTFIAPDDYCPGPLPLGSQLFVGSDGALYGVTYECPSPGGYCPGGTVFRFDPPERFTRLARFSGSFPSGLVPGSAGTVYLTLGFDGYHSSEYLLEVDSAGRSTLLHSFPEGSNPVARFWRDGVLYGTVGRYEGALFEVDGAGTYNQSVDLPRVGALVPGNEGAIYGITDVSIFRVDETKTVTTVHSFASPDGARPSPWLVVGNDRALYGMTTQGGGLVDLGTIFRVDTGENFASLYSFDETARYGNRPGQPVVGSDGALYGLSPSRLFRIDPAGGVTTTQVQWSNEFMPSGQGPVVLGTDGAFYWTGSSYPDPYSGFRGFFGIFRVDSAGNGSTLHLEQGFDVGCSSSPLALGSDGAFYGTTSYGDCGGDSPGAGTIFRIDGEGDFTTLHTFDGLDGGGPSALALGSDGALYGTTAYGGAHEAGTLFKIEGAGTLTSLHSFSGPDGTNPSTSLTLGSDAALYGITRNGGASNLGTIFRIDATGAFASLHSFSASDGAYPSSALVAGKDGVLYGITRRADSSGADAVFRIDSVGTFTTLHSFSGTDGADPTALVFADDCALYGTAEIEGPMGGGVIYRLYEPGHLCQGIRFAPLPDHTLGDDPFSVSATSSSGLPVSFRASGSCTVDSDRVTLTGVGLCTVTASQSGDANYQAAPDVSQSFHVLFDFEGFLRPLMNPPVVNRMAAGRTVPIRFSLGGDQGRDVLAAGSPSVQPVPCDPSAPFNDLEGFEFGHSSRLLHSPKRGTYTHLWQTDPRWAGTCQELSLELRDGSVHRAIFQLLRPPRPRRGPVQLH